jgi:hypothetical protein
VRPFRRTRRPVPRTFLTTAGRQPGDKLGVHARHAPSCPPDHQLLILRGHDLRLRTSKGIDHRLSVAGRPLYLSRYGRLISGPGGRGTARRVVRPVLTPAETLSAIAIDQDRDGRGFRLTSDADARTTFRSTRFHGAEPGLATILGAEDALRPGGGRPNSRPELPDAKHGDRIRGRVDRRTPAGNASRRFCGSSSCRRR